MDIKNIINCNIISGIGFLYEFLVEITLGVILRFYWYQHNISVNMAVIATETSYTPFYPINMAVILTETLKCLVIPLFTQLINCFLYM